MNEPDDYGIPELEGKVEAEADFSLVDVLEKEDWRGRIRVTYEYDFGDS